VYEFRDRFIDDMKLRGFADDTISVYDTVVRKFFRVCSKPPKTVKHEDIRGFLLYLLNVRKVAGRAHNTNLRAIKLFYASVQPTRDLSMFKAVQYPRPLPEVFTAEEARKLLRAVESLKYRTILGLMYSTGIRISECLRLKLEDVDSKRMVIKIKRGKGGKDRNVVLSDSALLMLRRYFREYRPRYWLFEGRPKGRHLNKVSVNVVFRKARQEAGIQKKISTTAMYTHVTPMMISEIKNPLDGLVESKRGKGGNCA